LTCSKNFYGPKIDDFLFLIDLSNEKRSFQETAALFIMEHSSNFVIALILKGLSIPFIVSLSDNMLLIGKKKGLFQGDLGKTIGGIS
jgi:hypothetical protein